MCALAAAFSSAGLIFCGMSDKKSIGGLWGVSIFICTLSFCGGAYITHVLSEKSVFTGEVNAAGVVVTERAWGRGRVAVVKLKTGGQGKAYKFAFFVPYGMSLPEGSLISIEGTAREYKEPDKTPEGSLNTFNEAVFWNARGVSGFLERPRIAILAPPKGILALRNFIRTQIILKLPQNMRGYILASWLGYREPELAKLHRLWGTSHVLAISGLHVGIFAALLYPVVGKFRCGSALIMALVWAYALFGGAAASALRAAALISALILAKAIGRPQGALNALCGACFALILFNPWLVLDLGFRLSFFAFLSVISAAAIFKNKAAKILGAGVLIWLVTGSILSKTFGSVPLMGLLINFIAVPFYGFYLPLSSLCAIYGLFNLPFSDVFIYAAENAAIGFHAFADILHKILPFDVKFHLSVIFLSFGFLGYATLKSAKISRIQAAGGAIFFAIFGILL